MTAALALISGLPREDLQNLTKEIRTLITTAPKVKRTAAVGQKAWFAFMRHCRDTMADRFTACKSAPDYAVVCKAIRQEDEAVYTAFVEKFKAENSAPPSEAEVSPAPPSVPVAAPKPAKAKPAKAKPAAKKATATAPISAEATPAPAEAEEDAMPKITIAGTAYWHDESTNGLYSIDAAGGFGDWVGYYQPDNEEEPIRYTATPE